MEGQKVALKLVIVKYSERQLEDFEKIKDAFREQGCTLLSSISSYLNGTSLLKYRCVCGNPDVVKSFINFKLVPRCNDPTFNCLSTKRQIAHEIRVKEYIKLFERFGCTLLDYSYRPHGEKWPFRCVCGNNSEKKIDRFKITPHCEKCLGNTNIENMKKTYSDNGCQLLDTMTRKARDIYYSFLCKCKEKDRKTYKSFEKYPMCNKCEDNLRLKDIQQKYLDRGATLLEFKKIWPSRKNGSIPLRFRCQCGNDKCRKKYKAFLATPYCDECSAEVKRLQDEKFRVPYSDMKSCLEERGYTILTSESEYLGSAKGVAALCPQKHPCHAFKASLEKGGTCCMKCGHENQIKTMLERYGVTNCMFVPEFLEKAMKNAFRRKIYTFPSGNETLIQGYENFCLDDLLKNGLKEEEIATQLRPTNNGAPVTSYKVERAPIISYKFEGTPRKYYPDFFIPHLNLIIEVKSERTLNLHLDKNFAKRLACLEQGYKFEFWIYNEKGKRIRKF